MKPRSWRTLSRFLCGSYARLAPAENHELARRQVVDVEQQRHEPKVAVSEAHHRRRALAPSELHGEEREVLAGARSPLREADASGSAHGVSSLPVMALCGVCSVLASSAPSEEC
jgi:hypothetical protein